MRLIIVKNFKCEYCGCEEYAVPNAYDNIEDIDIICDRCGKVQNAEYIVKEED